MKTFLIYLCLFILCFSCSKREKKQNLSGTTEKETERIITDTTLIGGALIELIDNNGKSEIKIHSEKYSLSGKIIGHPPFYFLRNNGEVLSFSYPDIYVDHTIIIQGRGGIQGILFKNDSILR